MVALHSAMNTAAGIPLPDTSPRMKNTRVRSSCRQSKKSPPTVRAGSSSAETCRFGRVRVIAARSGRRPIWMR
jgi:hypothetical protein